MFTKGFKQLTKGRCCSILHGSSFLGLSMIGNYFVHLLSLSEYSEVRPILTKQCRKSYDLYSMIAYNSRLVPASILLYRNERKNSEIYHIDMERRNITLKRESSKEVQSGME